MNPTRIASRRSSVTELSLSAGSCANTLQKNGTATPSFTSLAFDHKENMTDQEDFDLRWTTNSMYTGSIDTVRSNLPSFLTDILDSILDRLCDR